jgi:TusA-related sulfurtransferase
MYQQKIDNYNIIVVVIDSPSSKIETIKEFIPRFDEMLVSFERGNIYIIS